MTFRLALLISGFAAAALADRGNIAKDLAGVVVAVELPAADLQRVGDASRGQMFRSRCDVFTGGPGYLEILGALSDGAPLAGAAFSPVATLGPVSGQVVVTADAASARISTRAVSATWGSAVLIPSRASAAWGSLARRISAARVSSAARGSSVAPLGAA